MPQKSLIRTLNNEAATFVEEAPDGAVVVTVENNRRELSKEEWEQLPAYQGNAPENFNKPTTKSS